AIIEARGASSAGSAASAAIDHMRDWVTGTNGRRVSMGVACDGSYDVPEGLICGFPCTGANATWMIVERLEIDPFSRTKIDASVATRGTVRPGCPSPKGSAWPARVARPSSRPARMRPAGRPGLRAPSRAGLAAGAAGAGRREPGGRPGPQRRGVAVAEELPPR